MLSKLNFKVWVEGVAEMGMLVDDPQAGLLPMWSTVIKDPRVAAAIPNHDPNFYKTNIAIQGGLQNIKNTPDHANARDQLQLLRQNVLNAYRYIRDRAGIDVTQDPQLRGNAREILSNINSGIKFLDDWVRERQVGNPNDSGVMASPVPQSSRTAASVPAAARF